MKIALASDHGGFELKEALKKHLSLDRQIEVVDLGTYSTESVDYPVYGHTCGLYVASGAADCGIVCCGTGIGISIAANKVDGIRAAVCTSVEMGTLAKQHNNANVLALGGRILSIEEATAITDAWLDAEFLGDRHARRVSMLDHL